MPVSTRGPAPTLGAHLRGHWLIQLGAQAMVLGVTPFLVYEGYLLTFGGAGAHEVRLGVLAFLGLNLGILLLGAGLVTVVASRARRGTRKP